MGRSPARPVNLLKDGPRTGPSHHIFNKSRPVPARPIIFAKVSARPGFGPSHVSESHNIRAIYGPAQQLRRPARGFKGPAHVLFRT